MSKAQRVRESLSALLPTSWGAIVPPRSGWIRLFASFSSYLLVVAVLATAVGKALAIVEMEGVDHPLLLLLWVLATDALVYLGLAAIFAGLEARFRRAHFVTFPLALVVGIMVTLNTGYLIITGEQASWEAFTQLIWRVQDVADITGEGVTMDVIGALVIGAVAGIALPLILRWVLRRRGWSFERGVHGRARMLCGSWLSGAALLATLAAFVMSIVAPQPLTVMVRRLGKNAVLSTLRTYIFTLDRGSFTGYEPVRLVSKASAEKVAAREDHPNVLIVVLESTRYDKTSLSGLEDAANTPNLEALAAEGLVAHRARAVLPHTTKSLFSILCGRLPAMQKRVVEVSADLEVQCLPSLLREVGYATAFFQSSWGTFEWRPRLAKLFGFDDFTAWEDIQGQRLGYLASDDETLVRPFGEWLDREDVGERPFFATLLTSATHHPYRLSRRAIKHARDDKRPAEELEDRYLRLIEAEDRMLGGLLKELDTRGLRETTYVVVVGDHGEGFGEKGVKQHDNNFYEEGLRVPLVISGPGIERAEVPGNASLVDITPTLLEILAIPVDDAAREAIDGFDLLAPDFPGDSPRWFSCWFEMRCRGFVMGDYKVVYEPQADQSWYYNLAEDPSESFPLAPTKDFAAQLEALDELIDSHRARRWPMRWGSVSFGDWLCVEDDRLCKHPKAKKLKYRYVIDQRTGLVRDATEADEARQVRERQAKRLKEDQERWRNAKGKGAKGKKKPRKGRSPSEVNEARVKAAKAKAAKAKAAKETEAKAKETEAKAAKANETKPAQGEAPAAKASP